MPNSFAQHAELTCPHCDKPFPADVWLVVDTAERPDLREVARAGALHALACPYCGHVGNVDAPLLIYFSDYDPAVGQPALLFSPAQATNAEQDREQASGLLRMLAQRLGDAWQDAWLREIVTVQRSMLPAALSDDPDAVLREMQETGGDLPGNSEVSGKVDNNPTPSLQALALLWPDLPDLVGDDWPTFERELTGYLDQLAAHPERAPILQAYILNLFSEQAPEALAQLRALINPQDASLAVRHIEPAMLPDVLARLQPATVTRYTDISCPRRVWIETSRVNVIVRLTVDPPQLSDAPPVALELSEDLPVQVTINAPRFAVQGERTQTITIKQRADSAPIVFELRPLEPGFARLSLDFVQGGRPLPSTVWEVEIVRTQPAFPEDLRLSQILSLDPAAPAPDLLLYIAEELIDGKPHLRMQLYRDGQPSGQSFPPVPLPHADVGAYADALFDELSAMTGPTNPATLNETHLRELGQKLWWELFPWEFKSWYGEQRAQLGDQTLMIVADDPHIPWELVWPYDRLWEDETPWCLTFRLARWLRRGEHAEACRMPPLELQIGSLACVAPDDSNLLHAPQERPFLAQWATQHGLADASPPTATYRAVRALLEQGGYEWLHVAGHGRVGEHLATMQGEIALAGGERMTADAFLGPGPWRHIAAAHPGYLFNACHAGRQGWGLTYLSGWAPRLLELGASVVIAPLWTVDDALAYRFTTAFYAALLEHPIAEAVRQARLAVKQDGNPTWLAYSLYAHPLAQLKPASLLQNGQ